MVFRTWFSGLGISTLGPGFSHRGFRVAFGHGHPLVNINIMDIKRHMLICLFISMLVGNEYVK
jgi:hypothetical protein